MFEGMRKFSRVAAPMMVTVGLFLAACGGSGGGLSDEAQAIADELAGNTPLSADEAACVVGELGDDLDVVRFDTDMSEQLGSDGERVASAVRSCTGDPFETIFGYTP